ncbi:MAG TPA: 16S rRNA (guanine(527)-N(7))-methyltransferase RsmG [Acidobacteriaceae bacterium]|nr:16S rRNA (guanine(527)-N(7))-methyltransferase RsmG [Acidobacteriaceae bacterium]
MPALSSAEIRTLLSPFLIPPLELPDPLLDQVSTYLDLLLRWNARVSLTAIRNPEEIIQRHFGESFFTVAHLATRLPPNAELLDYGSGPGFPGLPIQMLLPEIHVTLAESQAKKVAFLREVIRTLNLPAEVWPRRVEELPESSRFDAVTMRAVEKMSTSIETAFTRVRDGGFVAALVGSKIELPGAEEFPIPGSERRRLLIWRNVPRGTFQK